MFYNRILLIAFIAWVCAQVAKTVIHLIIHKKLVWERLFGDGGMPSAHSAIVASVATATGIECGLESPLFAVAVILAVIVMHDAVGVRQETGKQAKVINSMLELFSSLESGKLTPEETLKEFVGHTGRQVIAGALVGIATALILNLILP